MAKPMDKKLESSIGILREALDVLPHGLVRTLENPIAGLVNEAYWLNSQRDAARASLISALGKSSESTLTTADSSDGGFEREQAAWLAIAEGLGGLGYELNSPEETRDWVVRNLL